MMNSQNLENVLEAFLDAAVEVYQRDRQGLTLKSLDEILRRLTPDWEGVPQDWHLLTQALEKLHQGRDLPVIPCFPPHLLETMKTLKQLLRVCSKKDLLELMELLG